MANPKDSRQIRLDRCKRIARLVQTFPPLPCGCRIELEYCKCPDVCHCQVEVRLCGCYDTDGEMSNDDCRRATDMLGEFLQLADPDAYDDQKEPEKPILCIDRELRIFEMFERVLRGEKPCSKNDIDPLRVAAGFRAERAMNGRIVRNDTEWHEWAEEPWWDDYLEHVMSTRSPSKREKNRYPLFYCGDAPVDVYSLPGWKQREEIEEEESVVRSRSQRRKKILHRIFSDMHELRILETDEVWREKIEALERKIMREEV